MTAFDGLAWTNRFASLGPEYVRWSRDWPRLLGPAAETLAAAGWPPTALLMSARARSAVGRVLGEASLARMV